jgi:hypothetical protein
MTDKDKQAIDNETLMALLERFVLSQERMAAWALAMIRTTDENNRRLAERHKVEMIILHQRIRQGVTEGLGVKLRSILTMLTRITW